MNKYLKQLYHSTKMYKHSATQLSSLKPEEVKSWIDSFDFVLTDCDGVIWLYNETISGSVEAINSFIEMGKKVFFVTNNSTKTRPEFLEKALKLKFNMTQDGIVSTAYLAAKYLKDMNFDKKVYVVASSGVTQELDAVNIKHIGSGPDVLSQPLSQYVTEHFQADPDVGAVIVGFDEHFSFPKMLKAATYLNDPNCLFIATNTDERFPLPSFVIPGTGSFVRAIETCAERNAIIMGKPSVYMCEALIKEHNINPARTLMIGDRCNTDILLGTNCGFQTLLVETGIHNTKDVQSWIENDSKEDKLLIPDVIASSLGSLVPFLNKKN